LHHHVVHSASRQCRIFYWFCAAVQLHSVKNKLCGRPPQYAPAPCKLTFDLSTLKVVSESRVPTLVFLGLSVLDLGPMYATDRQTERRQTRIIA